MVEVAGLGMAGSHERDHAGHHQDHAPNEDQPNHFLIIQQAAQAGGNIFSAPENALTRRLKLRYQYLFSISFLQERSAVCDNWR